MTPTPLEDILLHTLGLTRGDREYRNHFVAGPEHPDWGTLLQAESAGLMERVTSPGFLNPGDTTFRVTEAGKTHARAAKSAQKRKLTRAQIRYRRWLDIDSGEPFGDWLRRGEYRNLGG